MIQYLFFINGIDIDEPIGFDGARLTLARSENFLGLEFAFSTTELTFDGKAARILKEEFLKHGYDGQASFEFRTFCEDKTNDSSKWQLQFAFYSEVNGLVTINCNAPGFAQKFKNRLDTVVSLDSISSVGGASMLPASYKTIGLHSKAIIYQDELKLSDELKVQTQDTILPAASGSTAGSSFVYFPFESVTNESGGFDNADALPENNFIFIENHTVPYTAKSVFVAPFESTFTFEWVLKGNISIQGYRGTLQFSFNVGYDSGDITTPYETITGTSLRSGTVIPLTVSYDTTGTVDIHLKKGEKFTIYQRIFNIVNNDDYSGVIISRVNKASLKVKTESVFPASTARVMLIHDVFSRACELITDERNSFKSEFFGLTDQYPFYQENGCGAFTAVTNGKNIRNMLQKDGTNYPVSMSFTDLFKACDAVWNLGLRIEYSSSGKGIIRVEPKEYFFQNSSSGINYSFVAGIKKKPAMKFIYKSVEIGYEKWNLNQGSVNGIDEFNTVHHYSLPSTNASNSLTIKSNFVASGYVLELTRRIQFKDNPTTNFETDDDNFFICLNHEDIISSAYSSDPSPKTYKAGTVSERDEHFPTVENLISPSTAYNLRISPKRNLLRWWNYISPSLYWMIKESNFAKLQFQSGEGNILMKSIQYGNCKDSSKIISENQDLSMLDLDNPSFLFVPVLLEFTYPTVLQNFNTLQKSGNKSIQVNCDGVTVTAGLLNSLDFLPGSKDGGVGEYSLLIAGISGAAFSDGFSQGFDI